jgi:hypothetical protein
MSDWTFPDLGHLIQASRRGEVMPEPDDWDRPAWNPGPPCYLIGLDLGQAHDYTAWTVSERAVDKDYQANYDVRFIDRTRNARYPAIVAHTRTLVAQLRSAEPTREVWLLVDYTGVGRAVADLLLEASLGIPVILVTITGGDQVIRADGGEWRVPKRDLASSVQVLLQSERLRIGQSLPHAATLRDELLNFKVKISLSGHESYGADGSEWREGAHDDLVLSLALACWYGETRLLTGPLMV